MKQRKLEEVQHHLCEEIKSKCCFVVALESVNFSFILFPVQEK